MNYLFFNIPFYFEFDTCFRNTSIRLMDKIKYFFTYIILCPTQNNQKETDFFKCIGCCSKELFSKITNYDGRLMKNRLFTCVIKS